MSNRYLATRAFDIYCEAVGDDLLTWDELTANERSAWKQVAAGLRELILDGDDEDEEHGSLFDDGDGDSDDDGEEEDEDDDA